MPRDPNINALKMFDAAARHLNFRLAANELNLTQGAVAQQIRRLEADLDVQLFQRHARGLHLTTVGKTYYEDISKGLTIINNATKTLLNAQLNDQLSVVLSVAPSMAGKWLVPKLSEFQSSHPSIDLQLIASADLANFADDNIDLAIRIGTPPFADSLVYQQLCLLDVCAVCSPNHPASQQGITEIEDLLTYPLIEDGHKLWGKQLEVASQQSTRILQFNQTALAMDAAANGQGIALAPSILIDNDIEQQRLIKLIQLPQDDANGYYIVYPKQTILPSNQQAVVDWLLQTQIAS